MKKLKKVISLILTLFLTFNVSVFADDTKTEEKDPAKTYESYIVDQSVATVKNRYVFDDVTELDMYRNALRQVLYKNPELLDEALKGIFNNLDPNSEYYTKEEYDLFMQNLLNELCGIGVIVSEHDDGLLVSKVLKNTPASRSNLKRYDVIIAVDDISISGMSIDQAKTYIVGEKGTDVKLTVMRNGEKIDITMQRDTFVTEMGYYQVIENGTIGYINLYGFEGHASEFVDEAVAHFESLGIKNVIMDIRDNPGGDLNEYINICSHFIPEGPVIKLVGKNPTDVSIFYSRLEKIKFNLVVLVNGGSASASEAFSGAVQDTKAGVVIGETTFGKGTKQMVSRIISGGGIRLTDAQYLTAGGRNIHKVGITPDIEIKNPVVKYNRKYFDEINHDQVRRLGDKDPVIKAYKQRLLALGFEVGIPNDEFDEKLFDAVYDFQYATGLHPYGVLDFTTQMEIEKIIGFQDISLDKQLEKAIEILNEQNLEKYMTNEE
ncbi:MAG: PDZ domain-containing protein [Ruminococcaceae bacterium]|nr:PDZ domain-containing protein [Oscillospiraceae bacterium]